jgi:hypothetical protein
MNSCGLTFEPRPVTQHSHNLFGPHSAIFGPLTGYVGSEMSVFLPSLMMDVTDQTRERSLLFRLVVKRSVNNSHPSQLP